jgi:hypothetical protein
MFGHPESGDLPNCPAAGGLHRLGRFQGLDSPSARFAIEQLSIACDVALGHRGSDEAARLARILAALSPRVYNQFSENQLCKALQCEREVLQDCLKCFYYICRVRVASPPSSRIPVLYMQSVHCGRRVDAGPPPDPFALATGESHMVGHADRPHQ